MQVDPDAIEKLMITAEDFEHALEHDVKPVGCLRAVLGFSSIFITCQLGVHALFN